MKDKLKEILDIINHYIIIILGKLLGFIELIIKNIKIKVTVQPTRPIFPNKAL